MKQEKRRRIISLITTFALVFGLWYAMPHLARPAHAAVTQEQIDAMEDKLSQMGNKMKELERQLQQIKDDKEQAVAQKDLLDEQIELLESQINQTDAIIANYDQLITQKQTEIADIEAKEAAQYDLFCRQVRSMEEQGSVSYLSILFDSADFADLLDRAMMISEIMDYNNDIINMLLDTRAALNAAREELEGERADQQAIREQQNTARSELEVRRAEANALVAKIKSEEKEYQTALKQIEAEEDKIQAEIVRLTKELAAQNAAGSGGYIWPVDSRKVTSTFGPRNTGIPGASTNHKGIDIGGVGYTSKIYAAKAGTVIISAKSSSYGHYVSIAHPDGTSTLYAHMSSRKVSVGDQVSQGQVIGITGSTGISNGAHLHFEITEGGVRVDPLKYLKDYWLAV